VISYTALLGFGPQLHSVPRLNLVREHVVHQSVLPHHRESLEFDRRDLNRIHRPAATRDISDLVVERQQVLWQDRGFNWRKGEGTVSLLGSNSLSSFWNTCNSLSSRSSGGGRARRRAVVVNARVVPNKVFEQCRRDASILTRLREGREW
jgi:hypothetical protein